MPRNSEGTRAAPPARDATRTITDEEWSEKRKNTLVQREHMNALVMNFLITEGHLDAAKAFQEEAGMQEAATSAQLADETAEARMHVRNAVEEGNIDEAIARVNDLNPEILEDDARLLFHLQQQQLIELIRAGNTAEALSFAQECLAYKGEEDESLLDELEGTVALMAFPDPKVSPVKDLMQLAQREMTASELNRAILAKFCHDQEPKLASLLKLLSWGQERLAASVNFPKLDESDLAPHEGEGDAQEPVQ